MSSGPVVANDPLNHGDPTGNESGSVSYNSSMMLAEAMKDDPPDPTSAKVMIAGTIGAISCAFGCELVIPAARRIFNDLTGRTGTTTTQQAINAERASLTRAERSLERNVAKHKEKLADFRRNPDAADNQGRLAGARSPAERQQIIQGRERALEKQIQKNENELQKVRQRLKDL